MLTQEEFEAFYVRTTPAFSRYVARIAGGSGLAEEFVQESYLRLLTARGIPEAGLKSYLYRIGTNLVLDHLRASARQSRWRSLGGRIEPVEPAHEFGGDLERLF